ncbi:energy-coupling factor ABC transporter permease [Streptomyces sp. LX-29]|uniref:energy-coupling factor ABC transporter permease n=1 Tax=Streptomyces sp. LX-29 TaxID=2900152 RepID=UPI00240E34DD|nr:energy-coupling factor ABC transporter permease [Streptomyces sp. LX-29]WFB07738.1 energy-coupling factor ABC transporter permease [Streptomyces sp. LX-29]
MHVPDGFIGAPVSVATGAVATAAVAVCLRGARRELDERTAPLAGLVAAFVFAVQMLNFPVAAGTSGHLLGGALAAILVGPYTGVLCLSMVLLMQGVLFADGGLTALGVNITDMGVVTVLVAFALFHGLLRILPRTRRGVTVASFVAALVSVPAAAIAFTGLYALGGTTDVAIGKVFTAMVGVHLLIGIGEAAITALTVGAVVAVRPDLVHGARGLERRLELRVSPLTPATPRSAEPTARSAGPTVPTATARPEGVPAQAGAPAAAEGVPAQAGRPDGASDGAHPAAAPAASGSADASRTDPAASPARAAAPATGAAPAPRGTRRVWLAGVAAALLCAGVVSFYASSSPDGLEKVAQDHGIDAKTEEHAAKDSPLADYGVEDVSDARLSGGLAGVIGVGTTLAVGSGVFIVVRRRKGEAAAPRPERETEAV